jgi:tetratricopeptide (TPR) repeat protein
MDADERIVAGQERLIRRLLKRKEVYAYEVTLEDKHLHKDGTIVQRFVYPRLFRNHPTIRYEGCIHEQIGLSLKRHRYLVQSSEIILEHLGYGQSLEIILHKAKRNADLLRHQIVTDQRHPYTCYQLGNALYVLGDTTEASALLLEAIESPILAKGVASCALALVGEIDLKEGRYDDAIAHSLQSLEKAPNQKNGRWFLGNLYFNLKKYDLALQWYKELDRYPGPLSDGMKPIIDIAVESWKWTSKMAACYVALQQFEPAVEMLIETIRTCPNPQQAVGSLIKLLSKIPPSQRWVEKLTELTVQFPSIPEPWEALARQYWRLERYESARGALDILYENIPQYTSAYTIGLKWACSSGDEIATANILQHALSAKIDAYPLFQDAIEEMIKRGKTQTALSYISEMKTHISSQIPANVFPLINELETKLNNFINV